MCNQKTADFHGYAQPEDMVGMRAFALIAPEDVALAKENLRKALRGTHVRSVEYRMTRRDGTVFWAELNARLIRDEHGDPQAFIGITRDITARKEAEAALQAGQKLFQGLVEESSDGIIVTDEQGKIVIWNQAQAQVTGVPPADALGHAIVDMLIQLRPDAYQNGKQRDDLRRSVQTALETGQAPWLDQLTERYIERPDGTRRLTHSVMFTIKTHRGFALASTVRDITAHRQMETKLQRKHQQLISIINYSPNLINLMDLEGRYLLMNHATAEFLDKSETDLGGKTFAEVLGPETAALFMERLRTVAETRDAIQVEDIIPTPEGERAYTTTLFPLFDAEEEIYAVGGIAMDITERRRMEEALREREQQFRLAFENANIGVCLVSLEGAFIKVNAQMCEIFGYRREALETMTVADITHPEDQYATPAFIRRALAGEVEHDVFEKRYFHKGGAMIWARVSSSLLHNAQGDPLYFISHVHDITERKLAQEALRERERLFRTLFNNVKDGIFVHPVLPGNQPGPFIRVNDAACAMLGYSREELSHMTPWELDDPDSSNDYIPEAMRQLQEKGSAVFEATQVAKDGHKVPMEINANVCALRDGPHIISVVRDITARKRAENAVQARLRIAKASTKETSKALMQKALDEIEALTGSMIGFYHLLLADQQTIVLQTWSTNTLDNMCSARGKGHHYPIAEAGVWVDCVHQRRPVIHNDYATLPHRKGLPPGHVTVTRELVVPIIRSDRIVAILGVGNKPTDYTEQDLEIITMLAEFSWEIIERKRAEEELQRYAVKLERSNEALQQFAYSVSHDLKAPLRMVKSFLQLLYKHYAETLDTDAQEYIQFAVDGADQMDRLIHALLDYARVESQGRDPVPTDAEQIIEDTLRMLQFEIKERNAEVTHDPLPTVLADSTQLQQLLQNLISNAIKFSAPQQSPRVHISTARHNDEWIFSVADNGIGIAKENQGRIFNVFERLHTDAEYEGTGIGLAICEKIVARHGGRIWVESEVGEGSTFYFTLPAVESPDF
jgi:PAS domain S-box-containing protein